MRLRFHDTHLNLTSCNCKDKNLPVEDKSKTNDEETERELKFFDLEHASYDKIRRTFKQTGVRP